MFLPTLEPWNIPFQPPLAQEASQMMIGPNGVWKYSLKKQNE
jgi:hypothetical protein